ncbi:putative autophagy protein Apg5 [Talaromyces proteolyticus]|uniref:Autophagy protein 5 n=1 Tax=Talaromyces proteolyticus TaxID=1131652 RepID=A0AAD4KUM2_9EURO|nr:putative autophagy protein Apg5 [Talaromyces proteolyticus]KAH8700291.1 putative autophagy protein Apg5 [Talaromyces proteolyticus]
MAGNNQASFSSIQERVWQGKLPLEIVLDPSECRTYDQSDPYLLSYPRVSYLPFLLPRLHSFFGPLLINHETQSHSGWFSFEGVPLKWHYPLGLLYDIYSGAEPVSRATLTEQNMTQSVILGGIKPNQPSGEDSDQDGSSKPGPLPWRLTLHFENWPDDDLVRLDADGLVMHDAFINNVKEADALRIRDAKGIMTLSKEDTAGFWNAVQNHDLSSYRRIANLILPSPSQPFRNVPVRIFLPLSPDSDRPALKVVQSPLPPSMSASTTGTAASGRTQLQTVGSALHTLLPNLFPSRRIPVLAKPVLHGVALPMTAPLEEVARSAAYVDGWVAIVICMVG